MIIFYFALIAFIQVILWFKPGFLAAGGEESFSVFNTKPPFDMNWVWSERGTTGFLNQFEIVKLILNQVIYFLNKAGIPFWFLQQTLFGLLIFSGMTGVYLLTKYLLNLKEKNKIAFISANFYFLNLYTMSQVFRRFIYGGIFTWAYLPIFIYIFIKYINEGTKKYLLIFLITSFLFIPSFNNPSTFLTLAIPTILYILIRIVTEKNNVLRNGYIKRMFTIVCSWLLLNCWWLYPYFHLSFKSSEGGINDVGGWKGILSSLEGVSKDFSTFDVLTLKQKFYFERFEYWKFNFYSSIIFYLIIILTLSLFLYGIFKYKGKNNFIYLFILSFASWFISKGTSFPLGYIFYKVLFYFMPFMGVLRNSYEKFGSVWLLTYSIFFAIGLYFFTLKFSKRLRLWVILLALFFICGILVYPMWTGEIYSKGLLVQTPKYYSEMNDYLKKFNDDGRLLVLPLINDYGVRIPWSKGEYNGVNPIFYEINKPDLSRNYDKKYSDLQYHFYNNIDYNKILEDLNVKYLLVNAEYDDFPQVTTKSAEVKKKLEENTKIKFLSNFGKLSLYNYVSTESNYPSLFSADAQIIPQITYKKTGPTKYLVGVENANDKFNLIYKGTYNNLWIAKIEGNILKDHFLALDYANGWTIDKKGNYEIEVYLSVFPWDN